MTKHIDLSTEEKFKEFEKVFKAELDNKEPVFNLTKVIDEFNKNKEK